MDAIESFKKDDTILSIYPDSFPQNPRTEWENWGTMLCKHSRYDLGDEQLQNELEHYYYKNEGEENEEEFKYECWEDYIYGELEAEIVLPLYLYDHSGITMNTVGFGSRWDSGLVGYIYVTKEDIQKVGIDVPHDKLVKYLIEEVAVYDMFLRGEVYYYTLEKQSTCALCGHVENEPVDGCGGFYGYDFDKNGLYESAGINDITEWEEL